MTLKKNWIWLLGIFCLVIVFSFFLVPKDLIPNFFRFLKAGIYIIEGPEQEGDFLPPQTQTLEKPYPPLKFLINNGAQFTNCPFVDLSLSAGSNVKRMAISNNPEFKGLDSTGQIPYQSSYEWNLCRAKEICPEGEYPVYVRFYTQGGQPSETISQSIIYRKEKEIPKEILEKKPTIISFTRDLFLGARGEDVRELQRFLNSQGFILAETGPGSPGNETTYFGPLTHNAVIRFQEKYASEILTPLNLIKGTGYVGENTRAKINEILGK